MKFTKLKNTVLILCILCYSTTNAQIFKKLRKKAEDAAVEAVERKVEEKAQKETEKAFDTVFNNQNDKKVLKNKKRKKKKNRKKNKKRNNNEPEIATDEQTTQISQTVNYASDFVSGSQIIFQDQFINDALNDFPVTWNTNGSGSIVTFGSSNTKWLRLDPNTSFTPDGITTIPNNSTLEFDLKVDDNYYKISNGIEIVLAQFNDRDIDFNQFYQYKGKQNKNSVEINLSPVTHTSYGSSINTFVDGKKVIEKSLGKNGFNETNRTVHIAIWRQETRLRFYIDGQKIWDLPRAFNKNINYNALLLGTHRGKPDDAFYIANIRLAKAQEDTRIKLLETGSFTTNAIQFDSGKSTLRHTSVSIIEQLVLELNETPNAQVKIIGHTDSDGSLEANQTLSRERAYAVKEKMIKLGLLNYQRITVEGKGESAPIADNTTVEGKAQNRRVEFKVVN